MNRSDPKPTYSELLEEWFNRARETDPAGEDDLDLASLDSDTLGWINADLHDMREASSGIRKALNDLVRQKPSNAQFSDATN